MWAMSISPHPYLTWTQMAAGRKEDRQEILWGKNPWDLQNLVVEYEAETGGSMDASKA